MGPENVANSSLLAKKRLIRCPVCPRRGSGSPAGRRPPRRSAPPSTGVRRHLRASRRRPPGGTRVYWRETKGGA